MQRDPFTALAKVYDAIMEDVDYREWMEFIVRAARARGWRDDGRGPLLDLGCGTGNATAPAADLGYEVVGLDASAEMLAVARRKLPAVRFVQADFESFALGRRFGLVYSVFDSLNNLLTPEAFGRMAARVADHLRPGGAFVFDVNTTVGLRELWESGRAVGWAGDVYYNWRHSYDEATGLARVEAYCEAADEIFVEVHHERPYDADEVVALLRSAGFASAEAIDYPDGEPAEPDAPRIWVVATR